MKRNAFFQLVHRNDGVYLKSYPAVDGGLPLKNDDILTYLVTLTLPSFPPGKIIALDRQAGLIRPQVDPISHFPIPSFPS